MHDSASSLHSRTLGIQRRVPAPPKSEWRIKTRDQLPEYLRHILDNYPPFLTTRRAVELRGGGRSKLYEDKDVGYVDCVKDGGTTLWVTQSIVMRLANLPVASHSVSASQPATPTEPPARRGRGRPKNATPAAISPPTGPEQTPPSTIAGESA